jgi:AraC-like DNA-binding protein
MNKGQKNIIDMKMLKGFFHVKFNKWSVILSTSVCICICLYFGLLPDKQIFPNKELYTFYGYNDKGNGGTSEITNFNLSDTAIYLDFNLNNGFSSPYIGINVSPRNKKEINLSHYNRFSIDIQGNTSENIGVYLYTRIPNKKYKTQSNEVIFVYDNIKVDKQRQQYDIDLNLLKVPDWWYSINNISPSENIRPDLSQVLYFNIGTAYSPMLKYNSLQINRISFKRDNTELFGILFIVEIIIVMLLIVIHYIKTYFKQKATPITIAYQPVDIEKNKRQLSVYLEYINRNFHDDGLTLEQVSHQTGINDRRIANAIQQEFGCNFKTYVNQIRISEAKRLLLESDLNIGEIAFKVGFGNQSHFNRVFKSLTGKSPSEYREENT